jgi:aminoglycoside N3'-acetyltransferase
MGPASPLGLLWQDDGHGLLLGTGYRTNTFHHVVEMTTGAPCLGQRTEAYPVRLPDGRIVKGRTWGWRAGRCPFTDKQLYAEFMKKRALQNETQIGNCQAILVRLGDVYEVVAELLAHGNGENPPCSSCPIRPRVTENTVPSDWLHEEARVSPDSLAQDI